LVLCLGRLFPGKGQHYLLQSLAKVREARPDVHALIVGWEDTSRGQGGFRDRLVSIISAAGLQDNVVLAPARPEAPALMAAADIVAVPSTDDPCPLTVLEGMASGKPIVGFASGGIPEELGEVDGALVRVGDVDALADSILKLIDDPTLRGSIGGRNRERAASRFPEPRLAEDVAAIYDAILGRGPRMEHRAPSSLSV
jgi:glycosyltransferase involved in cell wall biosynthesis